MSKIKIAVITSIHPDFDARIWRQVTTLGRLGADVFVIAPWLVSPTEKVTVPSNIHLSFFGRVRSRWLRWLIWPKILFHLLRMPGKIDIIHFHDLDILPLMSLVSLFRKVVFDVHENYAEEMRTKHYVPRFLRPLFFHIVSLVLHVFSIPIRNVVLVVPHQLTFFKPERYNTYLLPNYCTLDFMRFRADDYAGRECIILLNASMYLENGALFCLDVLERLKQSLSDVKLLVPDRFAPAALREQFIQKAEELGVHDHYEIFPNLPPHLLWRICNRARVGWSMQRDVLKQRIALPIKLGEYMAMGLPIVSSDLPYAGEIIREGNCGHLVPADNIEAWAEVTADLLQNTSRARQMGRNGIEAFKERFNWEVGAERLIPYYRKIIKGQS